MQLRIHIKLYEISLALMEIFHTSTLQRMLILHAEANVLMTRKQILIERVMEDARFLYCDPDWDGALT